MNILLIYEKEEQKKFILEKYKNEKVAHCQDLDTAYGILKNDSFELIVVTQALLEKLNPVTKKGHMIEIV